MKCAPIRIVATYVLAFVLVSGFALAQLSTKSKVEEPITEYLAAYKKSGQAAGETADVLKEGDTALTEVKAIIEAKPFKISAATAFLQNVVKKKTPERLANEHKALSESVTILETRFKELPDPLPKNLTEDQLASIRNFAVLTGKLHEQIGAYTKLKANLANLIGGVPETPWTAEKNKGKDAIIGIPDAVKAHLNAVMKPLAGLNAINTEFHRATLLNSNADLSVLTAGIASSAELTGLGDLRKQYASVKQVYEPLRRILPDFPNTKSAEEKIETLLSTLIDSSPSWLRTVNGQLAGDHKECIGLLEKLQSAPTEHLAEAMGQVRINMAKIESVSSLTSAAGDLLKKLSDPAIPAKYRGSKSSASELVLLVANLKSALLHFQVTTEKLGVEYPVNIGTWRSGEIDLFYVEDVPRLISMLAGESNVKKLGGLEGTGMAAEAARRALDSAAMDVVNARADLSNTRTELEAAQIELEKALKEAPGQSAAARRRASDAQKAADASAKRLQEMTVALEKSKTDLRLAEEALARAKETNDPALVEAAQKRRDALTQNVGYQEAEIAAVKAENDANQAKATQAEASDSEQVAALKEQVNQLRAKVSTAQSAVNLANSALSAKATNAFLAAQIENRAFAKDRDSGVYFGSVPTNPGSSTDPVQRVYLYGSPDSKRLFIRGASLDVDAVKMMVAEIDQPGAQAMMTVYTLEIGALATSAGIREASYAMALVDEATDQHGLIVAKLTSAFRNAVSSAWKGTKSEVSKSERQGLNWTFYHEDVNELREFSKVLNLPNPEAPATLAEALVITVLATKNRRDAIWSTFEAAVKESQAQDEAANSGAKIKSIFPHLRNVLKDDALVASLREGLIRQLRFRAIERSFGLLYRKAIENDGLEAIEEAKLDYIRFLETQVNRDDKNDWSTRNQLRQLQTELKDIRNDQRLLFEETAPTIRAALRHQGISTITLDRLIQEATAIIQSDRVSEGLNQVLRKFAATRPSDWYEQNHAKLAKVNEGLITVIRAFDDDVRISYTAPRIQNLEAKLRSKKLAVGIFQKTSILASNRLVARVDAQGSSQLQLGKDQNFLADSLELARLFTANPAPTFGGSLQGLAGLKEDRRPAAVYGINSGSVFQITPVFDPSGQALRFRFDYVMSTQVRESNGTVDAQLPRVERHSVNTEVRLSNYEIRNVSQFNTNGQLGLPTRKGGGLPIFKDIYPFSEIPLIGWFTRREGRNATIQQSVILTQTSMYPTVQDIIDLLTSSDPE